MLLQRYVNGMTFVSLFIFNSESDADKFFNFLNPQHPNKKNITCEKKPITKFPDKSNLTDSSLDSITISGTDILKTIRSLDINKAHGHDDISIRMLKICDGAIVEPLKILFVNSVNQAVFPSRWKKANVILVHKKTKNIL